MYQKISAFIRKARGKAANLLDDFLWCLPPVLFIIVVSAATAFLTSLLVGELVVVISKKV